MSKPDRRLPCLMALALFLGCGGGGEDPFERVPVSGDVSVGGEPVEFGSLQFRGEISEKTQEAAQLRLPVRDGKFSSPDDLGTSPGENEVTLVVYSADPDSDDGEIRVLGTYTGPVVVTADQPVSISLESSELERPSGE